MKILQILPALNQGGVEHYVLENCQYITRYADSFVISAGGRLVETLIKNGSHHFTLPIERKNLKSLWQIKKLIQLIEEIQPDIIHIHSRLQSWLIFFVLKRLPYRPKIVTTVHGFNSVNYYSQQMLHADKVILVSNALKQHMINAYPKIPQDRYVLISQGIDAQKFNPSIDASLEIQQQMIELGINLQHDKILLLVGRITRIKGIPLLIQLMTQFKTEGKERIKAVIVGGCDNRNQQFFHKMKQLIAHRKLEEQILWLGNCDDMPSIYQLADITLSLTSKPESYGRTVLESLACGTPVIGFDYGGVGENLQKFFPAGKIVPHNLIALYEATLRILFSDDQDNLNILPISDTIEESQIELKKLYASLI